MTVEFKVAVVAHCPPLGVKEYVELEELFTEAGDQVPEIPLLEVVANNGAVWPAQNGGITVKVGVMGAVTDTGTETNGEVQLPKDAGPIIWREIV